MFDHLRTSMREPSPLPLFPLRTVLFPGGHLPLKVFEQRYVELVKRCLKEEQPFGVCLLTQGSEVSLPAGGAAEFASIGTLARIASCDVQQVGILHVATRGETRFRIHRHERATDGLYVGHVTPIAPEPKVAVLERQEPLAKLLEVVAARIGPDNFPAESDYADASWVGYRLAELLPLPLHVKQSMLEINDAAVRLDVLQRFLVQQKLL